MLCLSCVCSKLKWKGRYLAMPLAALDSSGYAECELKRDYTITTSVKIKKTITGDTWSNVSIASTFGETYMM